MHKTQRLPIPKRRCCASRRLRAVPPGFESLFFRCKQKSLITAKTILRLCLAEREGFEPSEGYKPSPVFKTGALNQLDHLSKAITTGINTLAHFTKLAGKCQ